MRGHIVKRMGKDGKPLYYLKYELNGRQKWEKVPWPRTRKHAEQLLAERLAQIHRGEFIQPQKISFAAFKEIWLSKYAKGEVRHSTLAQYYTLFRCHLLPGLGSRELPKISVEEIQELKSSLLEKDLSPQTVKHCLRLVRQMLNHAVEWGYIRTNPAKKVRDPRIPKQEMDFLKPGEVRLFLEHVPREWYAFFLMAITTGLRVGELLAARWGNLEWASSRYFVKETLVRKTEVFEGGLAATKTPSSTQSVDVTPICLNALRAHQQRQANEKLAAGASYRDNDLIFATAKGTPHNDRNVINRVFHPALKAAGLRRIRFHDLRHTCACLLIAQGENPKYIQRQLRHASIQITFDRYGHLLPDVHRAAAERLDQTLFGPQDQATSGTA